MGYRRMNMSVRPIQRIKHVVDISATVSAGAVSNNVLVDTVDAPVLANIAQVVTGSKINGIYLKVECASNEVATPGAIPNVYLAVYKDPGDNLAVIDPTTIGANDNKRFVFHQEMIMLENTGKGGNPRILFNGVIVIPKGYRRNGPNDRLYLSIRSNTLDIAFCVQCHYKEFR